jgi:geranylgeranyl reductase family protein
MYHKSAATASTPHASASHQTTRITLLDFLLRLCYPYARMQFDIIIVGSGPAGSYAAYLLAKRGARVGLIDKAHFPREKPCGGALSRKALDLVEFDLSPVIHRRVTGSWLSYGERAVFRDAGGVAAAMTVRSELDAHLLERAVGAGAQYYAETAFTGIDTVKGGVTIATTRGELCSRYVFAADGAASVVRSRVFGKHAVHYAPAVEALVYAPTAVVAQFADRALLDVAGMPRGYGWIFGKRDHLNAGVFSIFPVGGIRAHLAEFLARHPALARYERIRYLGHPIPIRNAIGAFERRGVWLLGDAAGLAEAVLGEGIYFALKSADLAARAFFAAQGNPREGDYTRLVRRELAPQLAAAERLARLCYAHQRFVFERIARSHYASGLFLGLVTGEVGYRECLIKAAATMPGWLAAPRMPVFATANATGGVGCLGE